MERLQKLMAEAGIASRRRSEQMIREGLVRVNGQPVRELPVLVDPQKDAVTVEGKKLRFEPKVYYLLHKPKKVVSTNYDPQGRPRAIDLLKTVKERVYPVGRLDADSRGLLLLTNDGDLANHLTHPKYGIPKTYVAEIAGALSGQEINELRSGMRLDAKGPMAMHRVTVLRRGPQQSLLEITLTEGRNRQVRRMLARLGKRVRHLTRVQMGPLTLKGLGVGKYRALTASEVRALRKAAQAGIERAEGSPRGGRGRAAAGKSSGGGARAAGKSSGSGAVGASGGVRRRGASKPARGGPAGKVAKGRVAGKRVTPSQGGKAEPRAGKAVVRKRTGKKGGGKRG